MGALSPELREREMVGVRGTEFTLNGRPIRFCGVNYGNWMLIEHYMLGLPWTEYKMRSLWKSTLGEESYHAFFDTFMDAYATDADFAYMKKLGFNLIQLPLNYRWFGSDRTCEAFGQAGFTYVDRFVELCGRHGMYALLSIHAAPGCAVRDWNAESAYGEAMLWDHRHFWDATAEIWTRIADRYRDDSRVMGYELLNEPLADDLTVFNDFNRAMLRAVRAADRNHIVVINENRWGTRIDSLADDLFDDPLTVPSFHHYHTHFAPFNLMDSYPGTYQGKWYGRDELAATMATCHDRQRVQRPHLVGECGVGGAPSNGAPASAALKASWAIWDDLLGVFNQEGFSWNFWAFKDIGRMGIVYPRRDTPWMAFLDRKDVGAIRSYDAWFETCRESFERCAFFMDAEGKKLFRFMTRHNWDAEALPRVLELLRPFSPDDLRAMARSFGFENCGRQTEKIDIVERRAAEVRAWNERSR